MGAFGIDAEERRREIDAMNRRQGIEAMMSRPKRDAFAMYRTPAKSQALPVTAEPAASSTVQQVVVGRPSQKGGLRTVSVAGVLVGHAQKVPAEHAS